MEYTAVFLVSYFERKTAQLLNIAPLNNFNVFCHFFSAPYGVAKYFIKNVACLQLNYFTSWVACSLKSCRFKVASPILLIAHH